MLTASLANSFLNTVRYSELDKMIPTTAFQPKWVSICTKSQFQTLATITTGGDPKWVNTPPTEILTNSRPSVAYFSPFDGLRLYIETMTQQKGADRHCGRPGNKGA